jgi:thioredoxin-related protein
VLKPDGVIGWQAATTKTLEKAATEKKAVLVYFPGEGPEYNYDGYFYGKELKDLSDKTAVFVRVPYSTDRAEVPFSDQSPIPLNKLAGDNPSRDYKVTSYPTFVVADANGNEYFRVTGKKPTAKDLEAYFGKVPEAANKANDKLQKNLDEAKKSWEKKDTRGALALVLKNFKDGVVGLAAAEGSTKLYRELLDDARAKLKDISDKSKADNVKKLKTGRTCWSAGNGNGNGLRAMKSPAAGNREAREGVRSRTGRTPNPAGASKEQAGNYDPGEVAHNRAAASG